MQHFFVTPSQVQKPWIIVEGGDVNHMQHVLRMKIGESLSVSDGNNCKYICVIDRYENDLAYLQIESEEPLDTELSSRLVLFQGLPKQDKMEWIVQKAVELGVSQVVPVSTHRCVVKLDEKKAAKKVQRWNAIAESAAKQAGRGFVPEVSPVHSYKEALEYAKELDVALIPYECCEDFAKSREFMMDIKPGQSVGIFIGPEGGFEQEEVEMAHDMGAKEISLGRRILRTETAGLMVLSVLMFHLEEA